MPQVHIRQRTVHFSEHGCGDPVILLHGLGSRSDDWRPQIDALAGSFRLLAVDLAGHGQSSAHPGLSSIADLALDIAELAQSLQLERAHVVGFSLGGMVGLQLALLCPQLVGSLTVINSGPGISGQRLQVKAQLWFRKALIGLLGIDKLARWIATKLFPRADQAPLVAALEASMAQADDATYLRILDAIAKLDLVASLPQLQMPVLVVSADDDYTPVSYKAAYAELIPQAQLEVVANSRHATPIDQPEATSRLLANFLFQNSLDGVTI